MNEFVNRIAELARFLDEAGQFSYADRVDRLVKEAADASDLIKINLSKLIKEQPRAENEDQRDYYQRLQEEAKQGPVFPSYIINDVDNFPDSLVPERYAKPFIRFLANLFLVQDDVIVFEDFRGIKDYINATGDISSEMSLEELQERSYQWHQQFGQGNKDISISGDETIYQFEDGFKIVKVSPENLDAEGQAMGHCVGSYCEQVDDGEITIYSLRDPQGKPHVTIEVDKYGDVRQIKGKQNEPPVKKYHKHIREWLGQTGGMDYIDSDDYIDIATQEELVEIAKNTDSSISAKIKAISKVTDPELQRYLARIEDRDISRRLSLNSTLIPELQEYFAKSDDKVIRAGIASNPSISPEIQRQLARDERRMVREGLAMNISLIPELQKQLSKDKDEGIVEYLALNPVLTPEIQNQLAQNGHIHVRRALAENTSLIPELQKQLARDEDKMIMKFLAKNPSLIPELKEQFSKQSNLIPLSKRAADASDLIKINLSKLRKEIPQEEGEDPREYYERLQEEAQRGPIFDQRVIDEVVSFPDRYVPENYAKPFIRMLAEFAEDDIGLGIQRNIPPEVMQTIKDYINATGNISLDISWDHLAMKAREWHEQFGQGNENISIKGDKVVHQFEDGFTMVEVAPENLEAEGEAMGHCVGGYCDLVESGYAIIYSLRDPQGRPHVTIEVDKHDNVEQIKGKQNEPPVEKYHKYIREWLRQNDLNFSLGFIEIASQEELKEMVESSDTTTRELIAYRISDPNSQLKLSQDESVSVRRALAQNSSLIPEAQKELANNKEFTVLSRLAQHHNLALEVQQKLVENYDATVRMYLAGNLNILPAIQLQLAEDPVEVVRMHLNENPNIIPEAKNIILSKSFFNIPLSKKAADISDLVKINLSQLRKEQPKSENEEPREYYQRLQEEAKSGPIFLQDVIEYIETFPDALVPEKYAKPFVRFLAQKLQQAQERVPDYNELQLIKDYINSTGDLNLDYAWRDLKDKTYEWHQQFGQGDESVSISGDPIVYKFDDGFSIVDVQPENLEAEGEAMGHCVGDYCENVEKGYTHIFSLRDPQGKPHATIEVGTGGEVDQIKGKQNDAPVEKYHKYIKEWLKSTDLDYYTEDYVPMADSEELKDMVNVLGDDRYLLREVAAYTNDQDILNSLSRSPYTNIREVVAENRHMPPEDLDRLSEDPSSDVRAGVAKNPSTHPDTLMELATDNYEDVIIALVSNPNVTSEILNEVAHPEGKPPMTVPYLLMGVAGHPNASPALLDYLSNFKGDVKHAGIRKMVADHPNTDEDTLERLSTDEDDKVAASARVALKHRRKRRNKE